MHSCLWGMNALTCSQLPAPSGLTYASPTKNGKSRPLHHGSYVTRVSEAGKAAGHYEDGRMPLREVYMKSLSGKGGCAIDLM